MYNCIHEKAIKPPSILYLVEVLYVWVHKCSGNKFDTCLQMEFSCQKIRVGIVVSIMDIVHLCTVLEDTLYSIF